MHQESYVVYGMRTSGNCYKVRLLLEQLSLPYRWIEVNSVAGETRTPEFMAKNPNGKVPLLQLPDGRYLSESNAILVYLADGSPLFPADRWQRAQALQWMFFEQYSHEPYIAVARKIRKFLPAGNPQTGELPQLLAKGNQALSVMEQHLLQNTFFAGERYSVADIALFAYTHVAADGGFQLADYPALSKWLARVQSQAGFVPM